MKTILTILLILFYSVGYGQIRLPNITPALDYKIIGAPNTYYYSAPLGQSVIQGGKVYLQSTLSKSLPAYNAYISTDIYEGDSVLLKAINVNRLSRYSLNKDGTPIDTLTGNDTLNFGYFGEGVYALKNMTGGTISTVTITEKNYDADAKLYIDSSTLSDRNQRMAADYLVTNLKANNLWTGTKALYPFYGNSTSALRNLKDPRNADAAFRLTASGTGSFAYNGTTATPTGNAYFKTHLVPSTVLTLNSTALGYYTDNIAYSSGFDIAAKGVTNYLWHYVNAGTTNQNRAIMYSAAYPAFAPLQEKGFNVISRAGATSLKIYNNETLIKSLSGGGGGAAEPEVELYINAYNNNGSVGNYSARPVKYVYIGAGLSDANASVFSKLIKRTRIIAEGIDTSLTITFDNSGNPEILTNYVAEININETQANLLTANSNGSNIRFLYNNLELPYYLDYIEGYRGRLRAYIKITIPANTVKNINMTWGIKTADSAKTFSQIMTRKQPVDSTYSFYKFFDDLKDSLGIGADFTGTNTSFATSKAGNVLTCNGTTAYAQLNEDLPGYGWLGFNFILTSQFEGIGANKTIFSKYYDANNYIELRMVTAGTFAINSKISGNSVTYSFPETYCPSGKVNSFSMRLTTNYVIYRLNEHEFGNVRPALASGRPITLGALDNGSVSQYSPVQFFDFEIGHGRIDYGKEISRHHLLAEFKANEINKWQFVTNIPEGNFDDVLRAEPSILSVNDTLWFFSIDETLADWEFRKYSVDDGVTWSNAQALIGLHSKLDRLYVFRDNGKYRLTAADYDSQGLIIYESTDGLHWSNEQSFLAPTYGSLENSCVLFDYTDNLYKGFVDVSYGAGFWRPMAIQGSTLTTMDYVTGTYPTTLRYTNIYSIVPVIYDIYGGCFMVKVDGVFYLWGHTGVPSLAWSFSSSNFSNDTWTRLNQHETFSLDTKWAVSQTADVTICEHHGKTFAIVNQVYKPATGESGHALYVYNGTLSQLVHNLKVTITP